VLVVVDVQRADHRVAGSHGAEHASQVAAPDLAGELVVERVERYDQCPAARQEVVLAIDPATQRVSAGAGRGDDAAVARAVLDEAGAAAAQDVVGEADNLAEYGQPRLAGVDPVEDRDLTPSQRGVVGSLRHVCECASLSAFSAERSTWILA
jgi:hypothetical protein